MSQRHFIHFHIPPSQWGRKRKYARFTNQATGPGNTGTGQTRKFASGNFSARSAGYNEHSLYHLHSRTDKSGYIVLHSDQPFLAMVFSLRGRAKLDLEDAGTISINDQSWFLLYLPGPRYLVHLPKGVTETMIVFLSGRNIIDLKQLTGEHRLPVPYPPAYWRRKAWTLHHRFINKQLASALKMLVRLKDTSYRSTLEMKRAVDGFMLLYSQVAGAQPPEDESRAHFSLEAARLAVNHIEKYFTEPGCGRLTEFSRMFNLSEKNMRNGFFALTGMSLTAYVRNERMKRAAMLIEHGSKSVIEVAAAVGYTAATNFTRDFKMKYQISPGRLINNKTRETGSA